MSNESLPVCPQCGATLKESAPAGLCPNCLMALSLKTETVFTDDAPAAQPPLPPEQLAPHFPQLEILECLGRGGMGVVYKARQKTLNRLVALKLLAPERVGDAKFAERFTREAQALAALNHPNIVTIYDFGQAGGFYFLLMEFVDGLNLRQLLRTRKLTPEEALAIVPPLCEALQFAHDRGIIHRDIKPENLLLDKDGRVKVADFGIAKMIEPESGRADLPVSPDIGAAQQHGPTGVMGTPGYSAPEQKTDPQRVDSRADIYSLGVVFYEMLTGELPGKRIEPPSRKVQIDVRLDEVVLRALEKKPELRYQQVSEVKTCVETILGSAPVPPAEPGKRPVEYAATSQLAGVALFLSGLSGVLGFTAFCFFPHPPEFLVWSILAAALSGIALGILARETRLGKQAIAVGGFNTAIWLIVAVAVQFIHNPSQPTQAMNAATTPRTVAFSRELEKSLNSLGNDAGNHFLDLDAAHYAQPPRHYSTWAKDRKHEWLRENGIDLMIMGNGNQPWNLLTPVDNETKFTKVPADSWERGLAPAWNEARPEPTKAFQFIDEGVELLQLRLEGRPTHPDNTFAFQTANGTRGLLQISGINLGTGGEAIGLKLRLKRLEPSPATAGANPASALSPGVDAAVFGPVIEREVTGAIDLDNGHLFSKGSFDPENTPTGIDAIAVVSPTNNGLYGIQMRAVMNITSSDWETWTAQQASELVAGSKAKPWAEPCLLGAYPSPTSFLFQTREGGIGLLQITGITENPRGVKLRYKLVQTGGVTNQP